MTDTPVKTSAQFVLPTSLVSRVDISRLVGEFEQVDNDLTAAAVRAKAGVEQQTKPVLSQPLADFLAENNLSIETSRDRNELITELRTLKDTAPILHMTFAVTADRDSLQTLTKWVRESIHPQAVIDVGLQPALVAGVYLRTPNHIHDLSLRAALKGQHAVLVEELESLRGSK